MTSGRPLDYRDVILGARFDTKVYVAAGQPPCISLRNAVSLPRGRDYRAIDLGDLPEPEPGARWLLAAILCPGDSSEVVVEWLVRQKADPERVLFILHPETDAHAALAAWHAARFPLPETCEARTFRQCAPIVGQFVNEWIYRDAKGRGVDL